MQQAQANVSLLMAEETWDDIFLSALQEQNIEMAKKIVELDMVTPEHMLDLLLFASNNSLEKILNTMIPHIITPSASVKQIGNALKNNVIHQSAVENVILWALKSEQNDMVSPLHRMLTAETKKSVISKVFESSQLKIYEQLTGDMFAPQNLGLLSFKQPHINESTKSGMRNIPRKK